MCHSPSLEPSQRGLICESCGRCYAQSRRIIDFLPQPGAAVQHELAGLASENGVDPRLGIEAVKLLHTEHIDTLSDLMLRSRHEPAQYYQQTTAALYEGLARARLDAGMRVLEVGSERTFFKLRTIRDLTSEAYALNIFFHVTPEMDCIEWPVRLLGDMNELPFVDEYLDLIICSASLHHTSTMDIALAEMKRVLRPKGRVILLNEPVEGWLKARGRKGGRSHDRHEEIHEDPVTWRRWTDAIGGSGLRPDYFLPAWFLQQLGEPDSLHEQMRFRGLARRLAPLLRRSSWQDLASTVFRIPAQAVLGMPLNVVLWKSA